jgi:hypothetical protein
VKIRNDESVFSNELLREVVRFVRPNGISRFRIEVIRTKRGNHAIAYPARRGGVIKVWLNPETKFPHGTDTPRRGGYLPSWEFSLEEILVHYVAHELRHLWQAAVPRGYRVWGARGRYSERDADAYGIRMTRAWRRRVPEEDASQVPCKCATYA